MTTLHPVSPRTHLTPETNEPLARAEALFSNFTTLTPDQKNAFKKGLDLAYKKILPLSERNTHQMARIFYLYGRSIYGGDMMASASMFQLSLSVQLVALKILKAEDIVEFDEAKTLEALPALLTNDQKSFAAIEFVTENSDIQSIVSQISAASEETSEETSDILMQAAVNLRWFGHSFQNIDGAAIPGNLRFFEIIYDTAKAILAKINNKESRWETGQILYNTGRFICNLKDPSNTQGRIDSLKRVLPFLEEEGDSVRAQVLRTQILNMTVIEARSVTPTDENHRQELLKSHFEKMSEAARIATSTPGFDSFLKTMFMNNKIRCALDCIKAGIDVATEEEMDLWCDGLLETIKSEGYNHYYHATFVMNVIACEIHNNRIERAKELLNLAYEIAKKFEESSKEILASLEQLKQSIEKTNT